jgi:hypothetical protein
MMLFIALFSLFFPFSLYSQDDQDEKIKIEYERFKRFKDGKEDIYIFSGRPILHHGDIRISAEIMLGWTKAGQIMELYAEGNVKIEIKDRKIYAEAFLYNPLKEKGWLIEFTLKIPILDGKQTLFVRARKARLLSRKSLKLKDASISTCSYVKPHMEIKIRELHLRIREDRVSGKARGITLNLFSIPLLYLPSKSFREGMDWIFRGFKLGRTSRFGYYLLTRIGLDIPKDDLEWGKIELRSDYRRVRGYASGIDLEYKWKNYCGFLESYYLKDKGPNPRIPFDRQFIPLEKDDRGRVKFFHRHTLSRFSRAEIELSYLSDKNILQEFYEREFKEGKEQENLFYLRWQKKNRAITLLGKYRLNPHQLLQVEYIPKIKFHTILSHLGGGFFLSCSAEGGLLRRRSTREKILRFDTDFDISRPFDLRLFLLTPFAGGRLSIFGKDLAGKDRARILKRCGIKLTTIASRIFDLRSKPLGIHKLRHLAHLEIGYVDSSSNIQPEELIQFDPIDALGSFEEFSISLRNSLQTKIKEKGAERIHEFLSLDLAAEYYPESHRDTTSFKQSNFFFPFNWILLAPQDKLYKRRKLSNLVANLEFTPKKFFKLSILEEYDLKRRKEEQREVKIIFTPAKELIISLAQNFSRKKVNAITTSLFCKLAELWSISAHRQYDLRDRKLLLERLSLRREFHDFFMEIGYLSNPIRDERAVIFSIIPKFLGKDILPALKRLRER